MGNEPAVGLEHLIPDKGGDYDIFAFGLQESTYEVKKFDRAGSVSFDGTAGSPASSDVMGAETTTPESAKVRRSSLNDPKELPCVEILTSKLQQCLGDDFYLVSPCIYFVNYSCII
jgi:hypothetical protein